MIPIPDKETNKALMRASQAMQHNTWTRTKPTITEDCLLVTMNSGYHDEYKVFQLIYDDGDIIPLYEAEEWGLWQDITAQQYMTLKLPI